MQLRSICLLLGLICYFNTTLFAQEVVTAKSYCNPLSLPNYPIGKFARDLEKGDTGPDWMWRLGYKQQFRELADVSALWHDNKWYLFPSVDMAWVSSDMGATWQHHPLNVRDLGYAPTIVKHKDQFLLMASDSPIYASTDPLGPYQEVGMIQLRRTTTMAPFIDPMLYSDDDGRLFYYWGCSPKGGIWGVELDANSPTIVVGEPQELIPFSPQTFPWQAVGQLNQNTTIGWVEGAWMLKHNGKYYLTYCAGGTENRTYAVGCYIGDSPMGPFVPQKRNPILRTIDGLITGTAHGSFVAGPNNELWTFYSVRASVVHAFERRLGMDRAGIDEHGELYVEGATSLPQWLPNQKLNSNDHATSWLPLNGDLRTIGSSNAPNLEGRFAVDNSLVTWWEPDSNDVQPTLTTSFMTTSTVHAARVIWREKGLNTAKNILPGPIGYRIEAEVAPDQWQTMIDRSTNDKDLLIDYNECEPIKATRARLIVYSWPEGITPTVAELTIFGETVAEGK